MTTNIKMKIIFKDADILYMEELSNDMLAFALNKNKIAIYIFISDEKEYIKEYEIDLKYMCCEFILNLKDNEMLYVSSSCFSDKKSVIFFDYENRKEIKALNLNVDFDNTFISRISNNIIAISESQKITLVDINKHVIIKSIDTQKNIHCLYNLKDKYLIVANHDNKKMLINYNNMRLKKKEII